MCVCVCVCVCARARARARVHACKRAFVCGMFECCCIHMQCLFSAECYDCLVVVVDDDRVQSRELIIPTRYSII